MHNRAPRRVFTMALVAAAVGSLLTRTPVRAAPVPGPHRGGQPRLSIASPATGNLVAGLVPVAVAFDAGSANRVTLVELWVDDLLYSSQPVDLGDARGTVSIDWDTMRLRNGQHSVKVRAFSGRKLMAVDSALVTVSNGGADVVPPLVSFYTPLDGQTVSGNVDIGVNASDNDQVALVGLFVNRQLKLMKSDPPFKYTLDTTTLPLLNGRGTLVLEAWAYDRAQNRGLAKPITVYVNNPINATPLQPDPSSETGRRGDGRRGSGNSHSVRPSLRLPASPSPGVIIPSSSQPVPPPPPRLSPLQALLLPPAGAASQPTTALKAPAPATPPAPQVAPEHPTAAATLNARPTRRLEVPLAPQPSPGVKKAVPPASRPSRTVAAIPPHAAAARLEATLDAAPDVPPAMEGPRRVRPARGPAPSAAKPVSKPARVLLKPSRFARVPDEALIAVPRLPAVAVAPPRAEPAARPKPAPLVSILPARSLPEKPAAPGAATSAPAHAAQTSRSPSARQPHGRRRGQREIEAGRPDRIELPVYRLARLPDDMSHSRSYTVRPGDTLNGIAKQHGVTPRSILVASGLQRAAEITRGTRLTIPGTFAIAYNDQPVGFDVQPRVERGMAIAPFRQLFEHTGGVVHYQPSVREVVATNPDKQVQLKIGSREALVNSAVILMDRAAFLDSGRTMVPVKFMTEALDLKAEYDLKTGAIYLIHK